LVHENVPNGNRNIIDRYHEALSSIPAPGSGCHPYLLRLANLGVQAGRSDTELLAEIAANIPAGTRRVDDSEIQDAIAKAKGGTTGTGNRRRAGQTPARQSHQADRTTETEAPPPPPVKTRIVPVFHAPAAKAALIDAGGGEDAGQSLLKQAESRAAEPGWQSTDDTIRVLEQLFEPTDRLFIGNQMHSGSQAVRTVAQWIKFIPELRADELNNTLHLREHGYPHIIPNPMTGEKGTTKNGKDSYRSDDTVAKRMHIVIEFDALPKAQQIAFCKGMRLPVAAMIDSGGKSIHVWPRVECDSEEQWTEWIEQKLYRDILEDFGVDSACKNDARLSRLPGVYRFKNGKDNIQHLLELNPGVTPMRPEQLVEHVLQSIRDAGVEVILREIPEFGKKPVAPVSLSVECRSGFFRQHIVPVIGLKDEHRQFLRQHYHLDDAEIGTGGFGSHPGQLHLPMLYPYPEGARQFACWKLHSAKAVLYGPKKGALVAVCRDPSGRTTGAQLLASTTIRGLARSGDGSHAQRGPRPLRWAWWAREASDALLPLDNGDLPLHVVKGRERGTVVLMDGVIDAHVPAKHWGLDTIAKATGCSFTASHETLLRYLEELAADTVYLVPDPSDTAKRNVALDWYRTALHLQDNRYTVLFLSAPAFASNSPASLTEAIRTATGPQDFENTGPAAWLCFLPEKIQNHVIKSSAENWSRRGFQQVDDATAAGLEQESVQPTEELLTTYPADAEGSTANRLAAWRDACGRHRMVNDASHTGTGKTLSVSLLRIEDFNAAKVIYLTSDARNCTPDIKNRFVLAEARHTGLRRHRDGNLRRVKRDEDSDCPPNCLYSEHYVALREKRLGSTDNIDICFGCEERRACEAGTGSYTYLNQRSQAMEAGRIVCHYMTLSPSMLTDRGNIVIVDEAEQVFRPERVVISQDEILRLKSDIELNDPILHKDIKPFLDALLRLIRRAGREKYGLGASEVFDTLEPLARPLAFPVDFAIERYMATKVASLAQWNPSRRMMKLDDIERIPLNWLPDVISLLLGDRKGALQARDGELVMTLPQSSFGDLLADPRVKNVILLDATGSGEHLAGLLGLDGSVPTLRQEGEGVRPQRIQICGIGNLTPQAKRSPTQQDGINRVVKEMVATYGDKTAIFEHSKQVERDGTAKFDSSGTTLASRFWVNTRATNDYAECTAIIAVGIPLPPIGAMEAEFASIHGVPRPGTTRRLRYVGKTVDGKHFANGVTESLDEKLALYIRRKTTIELLQLEGRLRAGRRPNEKLTVVYITDYPLDFEVDEIRLVDHPEIQPSLQDLNQGRHEDAVSKIETIIGSLPTESSIRDIAGAAGVSTRTVAKWRRNASPQQIKTV
jgi:hypothetical protein